MLQLGACERGDAEVRADCRVAAGDVESDTHDRRLVVVGGNTADGHHISGMPIGHERDLLGARRYVAKLRERLLVMGTEYGSDSRVVHYCGFRAILWHGRE